MFRYIISSVAVLALFLVAGCQPNEIEASLGQEFNLAIGQSALVTGEELKIRFIEVINDSRCPTGVVCIWEGQVSCLVEITYNESLNRLVLTQPGLSGQSSETDFKEYQITFNVKPYPEAGKKIPDRDYRLEMVITKKPVLSGGILVTFGVISNTYSIFITNKETIGRVFAVQREGKARLRYPVGV